MPRNFILMFQGKEGSSAYVSHLGNHPRISVPLFEELERHKLRKTFRDADALAPNLPGIVARIFETGSFDPAFLDASAPQPVTTRPAGTDVTGFKWRIWIPPEALIDRLRAHDVMLLNIQRTDFTDLMFSVYTTYVAKQENPVLAEGGGDALQFRLAKAGPEERAAIEAELAALRFTVDPEKLWPLVARRLRGYRKRLEKLRVFAGAGIPIHNISYEEFVADPETSLRGTLAALGLEFHPGVLKTRYKKVLRSDPRDLALNADEIQAMPEFADYREKWDRVNRQIRQVIPA